VITLRQLRYLQALAQHRHFGRAASDCAVTQPALSMQIRDLERELGATLVERRAGEAKLTEIGEEIVRRSLRILSAVSDLTEYAVHRGRLLTGALRLGVIPTLAPYLLPRILPPLQARYPELRLELRESQTKSLMAELARGGLDAVMMALPIDDPDIETMALFHDVFLLAAPAADRFPRHARIEASTLDPRRLILLEDGHCLRDQALEFCGVAGAESLKELAATSLATVMQMVANGYGITLVPEIAVGVEARDERVKLMRFATPEPGRGIGLAWRRTSSRRADFLALGQLVIDTMKRPARMAVPKANAAHGRPPRRARKPDTRRPAASA
jgi:LysR family transcriptional regulator, hydrogen peroxide-inducible genes activator